MSEHATHVCDQADAPRTAYALAELLKLLPGGGWVAAEAAQLLVVQHALIEALEMQLREPQA